ncbi:MAG: MBL fold metallo-hydrolase [Calditrichaeota bacterium]|nr:MBL fold metallo-hydrolase [Calditrichota bacterium]
MRIYIITILVLFASCSKKAELSTITFQRDLWKINDSTYISYRPDPLRFAVESNVSIFIGDDDILVVDAGGTPEGGRQIINQIKSISSKPVKYLVNTHGHGDHTMGNQAFKEAYPKIQIISHPWTVKYLTTETGGINYIHNYPQSTIDYLSEEVKRLQKEAEPGYEQVVQNLQQHIDVDALFRFNQWKEVKITPADQTVDRELSINLGNREFRIMFLGQGDTPGDLWIYLPNEKILCSGDALVNPIPYGYSRQPIEWLETLKKVKLIDFKTIIPGHGDLLSGNDYLTQMIALLEFDKSLAQAAISENKPIESVRSDPGVKQFEQLFAKGNPVWRYYFYEYFINPNTERFYEELNKGISL